MKLYVNNKIEVIKKTKVNNRKRGHEKTNYFQFVYTEKTMCKIEYDKKVESVIIRPLSLNIKPEIIDNCVFFEIDKSMNISVEINGSVDDALIIFAEEKSEEEKNENFIKFEKGEHIIGTILIDKDDTTLYLEDGAVLRGRIQAKSVSNLSIIGNGIITMEDYERSMIEDNTRCVDIIGCKNVTIKGIKILDSCNWSCRITGCDDVDISGVKIIGARGNSDGIDVCGSRNVTVKDCFIRVGDDSLVVKGFNTGNCEKLLFEKCTLWNDFARPIEVGVELRAEHIRNIVFRDIDIIHNMTGYPCMGIHHGDRAEVSDILFENIRIEDAPGTQLFDLRIVDSAWNKDSKKGKIHDIKFKDIYYIGDEKNIYSLSNPRLQGFNEESNIKNITFENIVINGREATSIEECNLSIYDYVSDVKFIAKNEYPKITPIKTKLSDISEFEYKEDGYYYGKVRLSFQNTTDSELKTKLKFQINPVNVAEFEDEILNIALKPNENFEKDYSIKLRPGRFVFSIQSPDSNIIGDWQYRSFDMYISDDIEKAPKYYAVNFNGEKSDSIQIAIEKGYFVVKSEILKENSITFYVAKPVETEDKQAMFTAPETDFGESPAVCYQKGEYVLAPQLRCSDEITWVFKNEPKVEKIHVLEKADMPNGVARIPFENLGIEGDNIWLEMQVNDGKKHQYPFTVFSSPEPRGIAHMFVNCIIKQEM